MASIVSHLMPGHRVDAEEKERLAAERFAGATAVTQPVGMAMCSSDLATRPAGHGICVGPDDPAPAFAGSLDTFRRYR